MYTHVHIHAYIHGYITYIHMYIHTHNFKDRPIKLYTFMGYGLHYTNMNVVHLNISTGKAVPERQVYLCFRS